MVCDVGRCGMPCRNGQENESVLIVRIQSRRDRDGRCPRGAVGESLTWVTLSWVASKDVSTRKRIHGQPPRILRILANLFSNVVNDVYCLLTASNASPRQPAR